MQTKIFKPSAEQIKQTDNWGVWEREPSEFDWEYEDRETCYILEGEARVIESDGAIAELKAGDMVVFPPGLDCVWKIIKKIRKKYKFGG